jgi:hypothetical protein
MPSAADEPRSGRGPSPEQPRSGQGPSPEQLAVLTETLTAVLPPGTNPQPWAIVMLATNPVATQTVLQLYNVVTIDLARNVYAFLTLKERLQVNAIQLLLGAVYIGIFVIHYIRNPGTLLYILSQLNSFVVPVAYGQTGGLASVPVRDVIFSLLAVSIVLTILMSAYAALFKDPPSNTGKEILKSTLAFATGVLATYLGAKS